MGDDFDLDKQIQTRAVLEALLGFGKGHDGRIINITDVAQLTWGLQCLNPKGDAAQGDHDIGATRQNLINLGIRDKEGHLNFDVLTAIGSYTREIYLTGEPDYFALHDHLKGLFGEQVPMEGDRLRMT